jgi:hypothetical protein
MGESETIWNVVAPHSSTKGASLNYAAPRQATPETVRYFPKTDTRLTFSILFFGTKRLLFTPSQLSKLKAADLRIPKRYVRTYVQRFLLAFLSTKKKKKNRK